MSTVSSMHHHGLFTGSPTSPAEASTPPGIVEEHKENDATVPHDDPSRSTARTPSLPEGEGFEPPRSERVGNKKGYCSASEPPVVELHKTQKPVRGFPTPPVIRDYEEDLAVDIFLSQGVRKSAGQYHWSIFLSQLFYQLMFPLSIPIAWWRLGRHALGTMSFLPATWRWNGYQAFVLCFQWGLPAFLFVSVGILGWFCQEEGRCNDVSMATFALGLTCFVMHRIIIAVKYGYMSSRQYRRIMSSAGVKGLHKNKNEQLLTSWIAPATSVVYSELDEVEDSVKLPLKQATFRITPEAVKEHWEFLDQCNYSVTTALQKSIRFPLIHLMSVLMVSVTNSSRKITQAALGRAPFVLSLILGLLPILIHASDTGVWFGDTWHEVLFNVCSLNICMMYGAITLSFCYTGILDFRRRFLVYRALVNVVKCTGVFTSDSIFDEAQEDRSTASRPSESNRAPLEEGLAAHQAQPLSPPIKVLPMGREEGTPTVSSSEKQPRSSKAVLLHASTPSTRSAAECAASSCNEQWAASRVSQAAGGRRRVKPQSKVPLIELDCKENVATWLMARRVVKFIGLRFWLRVQASMGLMAVASIILLGLQVADWLSPGMLSVGSSGRMALLLFGLTTLLVVAGALVLGALNNTTPYAHARLLNDKKGKLLLALSVARRRGDISSIRDLKSTIEMLEFGMKSVELEAQLEPVKILGIKASFVVFRMMCVVMFAGLGFLLKVL